MPTADGRSLGSNDQWTPALKESFAAVGASNLPDASLDAALRLTLPPGSYLAQVSGVGSADVRYRTFNVEHPDAAMARVLKRPN